jgi:hypothetical protein
MASTTFSGPVTSTNGIVTSNVTATGTVISFANLPTSDPAVAGVVWSNSGILTLSAG